MYTFGFSFKTWDNPKSFADAPNILKYLDEAANEYNIKDKIRYQTKVVKANFDTQKKMWSISTKNKNNSNELAKAILEIKYNKNRLLDNAGIQDYRKPNTSEHPSKDTEIQEIPNPDHPYGVKGVGEIPLVPPLAAIANAIADASGKRLYELPMSPPKVLKALGE